MALEDIKIEYNAYEFIEELMNDVAIKLHKKPPFPNLFRTPKNEGINEKISKLCRRILLHFKVDRTFKEFQRHVMNGPSIKPEWKHENIDISNFFLRLKQGIFEEPYVFANILLYLAFSAQVGVYFATITEWELSRELIIEEIFRALKDEFVTLNTPHEWADFMNFVNLALLNTNVFNSNIVRTMNSFQLFGHLFNLK